MNEDDKSIATESDFEPDLWDLQGAFLKQIESQYSPIVAGPATLVDYKYTPELSAADRRIELGYSSDLGSEKAAVQHWSCR